LNPGERKYRYIGEIKLSACDRSLGESPGTTSLLSEAIGTFGARQS
jgi:hypothetical protein